MPRERENRGWDNSEEMSFDQRSERREEFSPIPILQQSADTLRPGYPWIRHFQKQHPDYSFLHHQEIPWTEPPTDLIDARVALVSTAGVYAKGQKTFKVSPEEVDLEWRRFKFRHRGDPSFRVISSEIDLADLQVAHPYLDSTSADEDINVIFPLGRLKELENESFVGSVAANHISFMGYLPDPAALQPQLPQIVEMLQKDDVNLVLLTPGEVLSHQSMGMVQRQLEESGIATVSVVLCRDVMERVQVPRAAHYRHPFGYTFGDANDEVMHLKILKDILRSIATIEEPGEMVDLPYEWFED